MRKNVIFPCCLLLLSIAAVQAQFINQLHQASVMYKDSDSRLRIQKEDAEMLYVDRSLTGVSSIIRGDSESFTQQQYDSQMRIVHERTWQMQGMQSVLVSEIEYYYKPGIAQYAKTEEILFLEKILKKTSYTTAGLVAAQTIYPLDINNKPEKNPISSFMKKYDDQNRKIEEQSVNENDGFRKTLYSYTSFSKQPDMQLYENNELVYKKTYSSEDTYDESVFFADGSVIITSYKDCIKKKEQIVIDGTVVRSNEF